MSDRLHTETSLSVLLQGSGPSVVGVVEIDAEHLRFRCPPASHEVDVPTRAVEKFRIIEHGSLWFFPEAEPEARRRNSTPGATYDLVVLCAQGAEHLLSLKLSYEEAGACAARLTEALSQATSLGDSPYR